MKRKEMVMVIAVALGIGFICGIFFDRAITPPAASAQMVAGDNEDESAQPAIYLEWEELRGRSNIYRTRAYKGWLVMYSAAGEGGMTYIPDPDRAWQ